MEAGEEGAVGRERVAGDAEAEHGPLPWAGCAVAGVREAVVVVVMAGGGGYRGISQHCGRLGNDLVPADVDS